ncbi:Uncharacterised protein [Zhongshania aliphaticivorans]|uniref:VanZ-like domain-containing protein n=1 Tax=Zhongshania aliphaticivorans TaxID=1470434 RepID=A0A5S9P1E6_9GAMM|nr:VanZ family protein [Zhongshania aliphaticivorans]CAA0089917.1 Uncharacterised protein [Zhongshania aliphaticivorans]CAA0097050.1 Uncharacterised protein [Zhongshania aliphaticivorans]
MTSLLHKAYLVVILLYAVLITALSLLPTTNTIDINIWDKAQHFGAYALFMALVFPLANTHKQRIKYAAGIVIYGLLLEYGQQFSPGRDTSIQDGLANTLGVLSGYTLMLLILTTYHRYKQPKD